MKVRLGLVVSLLLSCGGDAVDSGRCSDDKAIQSAHVPASTMANTGSVAVNRTEATVHALGVQALMER